MSRVCGPQRFGAGGPDGRGGRHRQLHRELSLLQGTHLSKIVAKHGKGTDHDYVPGNREGQEWVLQQCEAHGVPIQREDAYTYAQSGKGVPAAGAELEPCRAVGLPGEWDDDADVPFPYLGGVRLRDRRNSTRCRSSTPWLPSSSGTLSCCSGPAELARRGETGTAFGGQVRAVAGALVSS